MVKYFSLRDVSYHPSTAGVRIIAETDIQCRLYCRLTSKEPWIHRRPVQRRGMWLNDDVRFCFVSFEDNVQYEPGETFIHTFWKPNWPPCITKWFYFYAFVTDQYAISTSPIFHYHNDGIDPVPTPPVLKTYTSIEPQFFSPSSSGTWIQQDASKIVDDKAIAIVIQIVNRDVGTEAAVGCRINGDVVTTPSRMKRSSQVWSICGLDSLKLFEVYSSIHDYTDFWVMGYLDTKFEMLSQGINIFNSIFDSWQQYNIHTYKPDAVAAIFNIGFVGTQSPWYGYRMRGSTDNRTQNSYQSWAIVGLDDSGYCEFYFKTWFGSSPLLYLVGYVLGGITKHQNALQIPTPSLNIWDQKLVKNLTAYPCLSVIEYDSDQATVLGGCQKGYSRIDEKHTPTRKSQIFVHPTHFGYSNFYRSHANQKWWLSSEFES